MVNCNISSVTAGALYEFRIHRGMIGNTFVNTTAINDSATEQCPFYATIRPTCEPHDSFISSREECLTLAK